MFLETVRSCLHFVAALVPQTPDLPVVSAPSQDLRAFLRERHRDEWEAIRNIRFESFVPYLNAVVARADLNGDGRLEAVVHLLHPLCGTAGCGIDVYTDDGERWRHIGRSNTGWPPFRVLEGGNRGWRNLGMIVAGGGELRGFQAALGFDGRTYRERARGPVERRDALDFPGRTIISRGNRGRPLF